MGAKGKTLTTLGVIGLLVVLIFIYLVANSAKKLAQSNRDLITPHLGVHVIAGGPTELKELFKDAVGKEEDPAKIKAKYVWITTLVKNTGLSEVKDIATVIDLNSKIHKIYTAQPKRYYDKIKLEERKENEARFTTGGLRKDNSFVIFLGLQPETFEGKPPFDQKERQLWKRDYRISFQKVKITTDDFQKVVY